ncbi:MAG: hypothetical protein IIX36_03240 [Clostridia bacterium]|nr:hypothetical protein [Clostridia bacterium]
MLIFVLYQVWQGKWYTMDELISVCGLGSVTEAQVRNTPAFQRLWIYRNRESV